VSENTANCWSMQLVNRVLRCFWSCGLSHVKTGGRILACTVSRYALYRCSKGRNFMKNCGDLWSIEVGFPSQIGDKEKFILSKSSQALVWAAEVESPSLRDSRNVEMWHWGTWFGGHDEDGLTVGLDDLKGLSQPLWFYNLLHAPRHLSWSTEECAELSAMLMLCSPTRGTCLVLSGAGSPCVLGAGGSVGLVGGWIELRMC